MPERNPRHVIIVTEKNSVSIALCEAIQRVRPWPGALVTFLPTMMLGLFRFRHPEGLRASDYPYVGDPVLQPRSDGWEGGWPVLSCVCGGDADGRDVRSRIGEPDAPSRGRHEDLVRHGSVSRLLGDGTTTIPTLESLLDDADIIVKATEAYRGTLAFRDIVTLGKTREVPVHITEKVLDAAITSMGNMDLDNLVASMVLGQEPSSEHILPWHSRSREMLYGEAKEFMDWNWDVNASATLSAAFRAACLRASIDVGDGNTLSAASLVRKYAILLAHAVRRGEVPCGDDGALIRAMKDWKGTGRHAVASPVAWKGFNDGIGTIASRAAIIESLLRVGVCERMDAVTYSIPYAVRSLHLYGYDPGLAGAMQAVLPLLRAGSPLPTLRQLLAQSSMLSVKENKVLASLPMPTDMFLALDAGVLASRDGKPEPMLPESMRLVAHLAVFLSSIDGGLDEPLTPGRLKTAGMLEARKMG